ncbi:hypothetical protein R1sor_017514 [Riccia sorocarpa]|uniref:Reverse transcriptase Ty1/copia-type domain-containing protein n=1 Tax=Riccia sorocarpa TaxID=122646 RepID=A0ABD3IB48_9MARC
MKDCIPHETPMEVASKKMDEDSMDELPQDIPYRELIGCLMYLNTTTRPDICFSTGHLSQFNNAYTQAHWLKAKRILRYLSGTKHLGISYSDGPDSLQMVAFTDASWGTGTDAKSITGVCYILGSGAVAWLSKKQHVVARSSAEAEYIALSTGTRDIVWFRRKDLVADFFTKSLPAPAFKAHREALSLK